MTSIPFLSELVLLAAAGVLAAVLLARIGVPIITVLLIAGALVGPYGLGLVRDPHTVEALAEVGVVLLLFTIGLELSLSRLARIGRLVAAGGALQVGLTIAAVAAVLALLGFASPRAAFYGLVVALSSTALVLRALSERSETEAPHGRFVVGALIFQDLCVVPMMLLIPVLAGRGGDHPVVGAAIALGKAALVVTAALVLARALVPRFFALVDRARSREIFLLSVLLVCIGTAWLTSLAGLSLALGAFLAGVVLADTDYAQRAMADVLPLRDVLTSLFFMSLGMLFDARILLHAPGLVGAVFLALLLGKGAVATAAALVMRFPPRVAVMAGVGLAQFSEFGFVLARAGEQAGLARAGELRVLFGAAVLTMLVTPVAVRLAPSVGAGAGRLRVLSRLLGAREISEPAAEDAALEGHVIVVGFGIAGRVLAGALRRSGVPHLIVEINADTVRRARGAGEPAYYGDIASPEALAHARAGAAKALVLLINDPPAAERAVAAARRHAPDTPVFVRTRYLRDAPRLRELGAAEVVVEEVEAGIEVLARALRHAGVPRNVALAHIDDARRQTHEAGSRPVLAPRRLLGAARELEALKVESVAVLPGAHADGRSAVDMALRQRTGALIIAVQRGGALMEQCDPAEPFSAGDVLFLVGTRTALARAAALIERGEDGEDGEP